MDNRLLIAMAAMLIISMLSCSGPSETPKDFISEVQCGAKSGEFAFTLSNPSDKQISLSKAIDGAETLRMEFNGVELTGIANYCGRPSLAPGEIVKCRRPGTSQTDAGIRIKTGRELIFLKATNNVRSTLGDTTHGISLVCD